MKQKHTEGLFVKGTKHLFEGLSIEDKTLQVFLLSGPDNKTIALIPLWPDKIEEQEANADLFAAAPETAQQRDELLKACKAILDMYKQQLRESRQDSFVIEQAETAIAKAEPAPSGKE